MQFPTLLLLLCLAFPLALAAGQERCKSESVISTIGTGTVTLVPDLGVVSLQITAKNETMLEAREAAAQTASAVKDAVSAIDGINATSDITTTGITSQPDYIWDENLRKSVPAGYTFIQMMQITISDLSSELAAEVVDKASEAGGDLLFVNSIVFQLAPKTRDEALDEARHMAVQNAIHTAQLLADSANVTVGRVISISDSNTGGGQEPIPAKLGAENRMADAGATPTPVSLGTTDLTATVSMEFAISH